MMYTTTAPIVDRMTRSLVFRRIRASVPKQAPASKARYGTCCFRLTLANGCGRYPARGERKKSAGSS